MEGVLSNSISSHSLKKNPNNGALPPSFQFRSTLSDFPNPNEALRTMEFDLVGKWCLRFFTIDHLCIPSK